MKIALYARCSTKDKQDPTTQLLPLRDYASQRQAEILEYTDIGISGSVSSRPELDRLMEDARRHKFNAVVVARFDRFARSTKHLITALEEFRKLGIDFISINEGIDTSTSIGKLVFTLIAAIAEFERNLIRERVMAGLDRAKREGKRLGPRPKIVDKEHVKAMYTQTQSLRETARMFGIGKDKVAELLK